LKREHKLWNAVLGVREGRVGKGVMERTAWSETGKGEGLMERTAWRERERERDSSTVALSIFLYEFYTWGNFLTRIKHVLYGGG